MTKIFHEIRDPIHTFVRLDSNERAVLDSRPLQRLRHIHQLGMSHFVYPGATHTRFEHSLGVMELAGRVFDVITNSEPVLASVRRMIPKPDGLRYWRRVLRMAALCHDVGHLPFSHVAETKLLPGGWSHERLTVEIIRSSEMQDHWSKMTPPLRWLDVVKLAVGKKHCDEYVRDAALPSEGANFSDWETILAEVITGDALGVDRMDYLLRDAHHAGVAYGRFDHSRLLDTLRILPKEYEDSEEPALGVEEGGLHSAEALLLARYLMYPQVYFHPVCKAYELHLIDFLDAWRCPEKPDRTFPITVTEHLAITDNEATAALLRAADDSGGAGHEPARRVVRREHYRELYRLSREDAEKNADAGQKVLEAAQARFGEASVRRTCYRPKDVSVDFPVLLSREKVVSARRRSEVLASVPPASFDFVFVDPEIEDDANRWLTDHREEIITRPDKEEDDGSLATQRAPDRPD